MACVAPPSCRQGLADVPGMAKNGSGLMGAPFE